MSALSIFIGFDGHREERTFFQALPVFRHLASASRGTRPKVDCVSL